MLAATAASAQPYRLLVIDGQRLKWGTPELGSGAEVSYGFATEAASFPDAINCRSMAPISLLETAWAHDAELLAEIAAEAFAMWSVVADIRFRPAAQGEVPDILIGAQGVPHRIAFANVWFDDAAADRGSAPLTRATICFNPQIAWSLDAPLGGPDFPTVLAHEIGHAIGLDHPGPTGALMGFQNQGDIDTLMAGDAAGAIALYGARPLR